ncbi:MAG: hypothetical protein J6W84_01680 [Bacteroidales bacterium]|nr:hypothetical protein [Bacteroidales bacterium]
MPDREIVSKGMECIRDWAQLKAKQVILQRLGSDVLVGYECWNCGKHINQNDKYCKHCRRKVKWE